MNYITNIKNGWIYFNIPVVKRTDKGLKKNISFNLSYIENIFELINVCNVYYNNDFSAYQFDCEDDYINIILYKDDVIFTIDDGYFNAYICMDNTKTFIKKIYDDIVSNIDELISMYLFNFKEGEDKSAYIEEFNKTKEYILKKLKELSYLSNI
jgi:hypothetical protein